MLQISHYRVSEFNKFLFITFVELSPLPAVSVSRPPESASVSRQSWLLEPLVLDNQPFSTSYFIIHLILSFFLFSWIS